MKRSYEDIMNLPHHVSLTRTRMSAHDRAAQFSPFAALTGYDSAVKETARLTDNKVDLDDYMKDTLSNKLQNISDRINEYPEIAVTYFKPDDRKSGGIYVTAICSVKKIDEYKRVIFMNDDTVIPIDEILSIEGQIFDAIIY